MTNLTVFATIGGAIFLSAAQAAFNNQILKSLSVTLPGVSPATALGTGATEIRKAFTGAELPFVLDAYTDGLKAVFAIGIAAFGTSACAGTLGSWKRLSETALKAATGASA